MKAISDINGFDIKSHGEIPIRLVGCLRAWFSETIKLKGLNSSEKIYVYFIQFNTDLFKTKVAKYQKEHTETVSESFAKSEIEEMRIPEYISEISNWLDQKQ